MARRGLELFLRCSARGGNDSAGDDCARAIVARRGFKLLRRCNARRNDAAIAGCTRDEMAR